MRMQSPMVIHYETEHTDAPFYMLYGEVNSSYPLHRHEFFEFSYARSGSGTEIINGTAYRMQEGACTFLFPYQCHEIHADPESPLQLYSCALKMEDLLSEGHLGLGLTRIVTADVDCPPTAQLNLEETARMHSIFAAMSREFQKTQGFWRDSLLRCQVFEALLLFDRARKNREHPAPAQFLRSSRADVWEIINFIELHASSAINLTNVASRFHLSVPYLSQLIKRYMGKGFTSYVHEVRIQYAMSLLLLTDLKITDIALEVGFRSFSAFSRVFHEQTGMGPAAYRRLKCSGPETCATI